MNDRPIEGDETHTPLLDRIRELHRPNSSHSMSSMTMVAFAPTILEIGSM